MKKIKILLSTMMPIGLFSTIGLCSCGCQNNDPQSTDVVSVKNFTELKSAIETKALQGTYTTQTIEITEDIVCEEPIYVMNDTTIICKENHSITRASTFLDDLFVVGEDENGNNPILTGELARLTFKTQKDATLTIDGNKDSITDNIYGSAIFISNHSEVNLNNNVVIQNFRKDSNKRALTKYVSRPIQAGGAAAIITSGTLNMYGGTIDNCSCPAEDESEDKAYMGGAIYNEAGLNMYGGTISNCSAARGGAIYQYSYCNLVAGTISNCSATSYGGALYLTDSQYTNTVLGSEDGSNQMIFKENSSSLSGGAIFGRHQSVIYSLGNCIFDSNTAINNGGAINSPGAILLDNTKFINNNVTGSSSKGGAIYSYCDSSTLTVRELQANGCTFESNSSVKSGGAIGFSVGDSEITKSAIGIIKNSTFTKNSSGTGGAIWAASKSNVSISGSEFNENSSTGNGGAIYNTSSTINLNKSDNTNTFSKNTSQAKGGAIAVHSGGIINIQQATFNENSSKDNGGALYLYGGSGNITSSDINDVMFYKNKTIDDKTDGGAIYISATADYVSELKGTKLTIKENSATRYGGGIYINTADSSYAKLTTLDLEQAIIDNNSSGGNGAGLYATGQSIIKIKDLEMNQNTTTSNGGGMYLTSGVQTTLDYVNANNNSANIGGFIYITSTDTTLIIKSGKAYDNTATAGSDNGATLWCNYKKSVIKIKGKLTKEYFDYNGDISGVEGFEVLDYEE